MQKAHPETLSTTVTMLCFVRQVARSRAEKLCCWLPRTPPVPCNAPPCAPRGSRGLARHVAHTSAECAMSSRCICVHAYSHRPDHGIPGLDSRKESCQLRNLQHYIFPANIRSNSPVPIT